MDTHATAAQLAQPQLFPTDPPARRGDWMQTYSGLQFWPLDPRVDEIAIEDIAHALANTCRYNGHCGVFYSVAEHCVILSGFASRENKLAALLHDAAEAYTADIPRPLKRYLDGYRLIEERIERAIAAKFGVKYPWAYEIHELDERILGDERDQIMAKPPADWGLSRPPLNAYLPCWDPTTAKHVFLHTFRALSQAESFHRPCGHCAATDAL
jgi:hypothetical protein